MSGNPAPFRIFFILLQSCLSLHVLYAPLFAKIYPFFSASLHQLICLVCHCSDQTSRWGTFQRIKCPETHNFHPACNTLPTNLNSVLNTLMINWCFTIPESRLEAPPPAAVFSGSVATPSRAPAIPATSARRGPCYVGQQWPSASSRLRTLSRGEF